MFVRPIIATEKVLDGSRAFEFEAVFVDQGVGDSLGVLGRDGKVVDVDGDVFVVRWDVGRW